MYYLLSSAPQTGKNGKNMLAPTYYPSALTPDAALPIRVNAGDRLMELLLEVQEVNVHRISGRIMTNDRMMDIGKVLSLDLIRRIRGSSSSVIVDPVRAPLPQPYEKLMLSPDGSFHIDGVLPGSYDLLYKWKGSYGKSLASEIEMPNKDLDDLKVEFQLPIRVSGRLEVDPGKEAEASTASEALPLPKAIWIGSDEDVDLANFSVPVDAKGNFSIPALTVGKYQVYLFGGIAGATKFHVASINWNGTVMPTLSFGVTGVGEGRLLVKLKAGRAEVKGIAPAGSTKAILFPIPLRDLDLIRGAVLTADIDSQGAFGHQGVVPGRYSACAVDTLAEVNFQSWANDPGNAATLDSYCEKLEVKGSEAVRLLIRRTLKMDGREAVGAELGAKTSFYVGEAGVHFRFDALVQGGYFFEGGGAVLVDGHEGVAHGGGWGGAEVEVPVADAEVVEHLEFAAVGEVVEVDAGDAVGEGEDHGVRFGGEETVGLEEEAQSFVGEPEGVVLEDHLFLDLLRHGIDEPLLAELDFAFVFGYYEDRQVCFFHPALEDGAVFFQV